VWAWLVAAGLATAVTAAVRLAAQTPAPPALLADMLQAKPEWRLLDPALDLVGEYTVAQLVELDRWPPWIELDFDRDGKDDVAAVVVRKGAAGDAEFAVAVVHGATPTRSELVGPFGPRRIFGVSEGIKDDTVMPLYCADCDANIWHRWNGRAYEPWLYAVGESVRIGGEAGRRTSLFAAASSDTARSAEASYCARAQVQEVGGDSGRRWYRVEVVAASFPRGWVPQQLVLSDADCKE
jgi:hypothetical protein